jgi:hypothetical protein
LPGLHINDRQMRRRNLELEAATNKLDTYQLPILDDIAYVTKDHPCRSRPTNRSVNGARSSPTKPWRWRPATGVHHATILEMNVASYCRKVALKRKRGKGD